MACTQPAAGGQQGNPDLAVSVGPLGYTKPLTNIESKAFDAQVSMWQEIRCAYHNCQSHLAYCLLDPMGSCSISQNLKSAAGRNRGLEAHSEGPRTEGPRTEGPGKGLGRVSGRGAREGRWGVLQALWLVEGGPPADGPGRREGSVRVG